MVRGAERGRAAHRGPDAHVRQHHVPDQHGRRTAPGARAVEHGRRAAGHAESRGRHGHLRHDHRWLRQLFGDPAHAELLAGAESSGPGARGLLMLPYFAGERTPVADPDARGVIAGLTVEHTRGDLYRAALEATALGVRHNVGAMRAAGADIRRVVAVGGGTRGGLWTRIVSDVTGLAQEVRAVTVGASYGAAFLAAGAVGDPDIGVWNPVRARVEPDPGLRTAYDELYGLYLDLYPATRDIGHALARRRRAASGPPGPRD
ncbi:FGGY-family carbohydrate kinase [Streptomyces sp. NPDC086783]|uniref:xylulokinase n=1 Tax=Streptomyces sp. NPDC086783 TaxID=3365758 RepID=UPI00380E80FF